MPTIAQVLASRPKPDQPLQEHINWYVGRGYFVQSQTESSAQLMKKKQFSFVWALLWFLLLGVGLAVYLIYYLAKRDQVVYLTVSDGMVNAQEGRA